MQARSLSRKKKDSPSETVGSRGRLYLVENTLGKGSPILLKVLLIVNTAKPVSLGKPLQEINYDVVKSLRTFQVNEMPSVGQDHQLSSRYATHQQGPVFGGYQ